MMTLTQMDILLHFPEEPWCLQKAWLLKTSWASFSVCLDNSLEADIIWEKKKKKKKLKPQSFNPQMYMMRGYNVRQASQSTILSAVDHG
jgi:hypothetical protein